MQIGKFAVDGRGLFFLNIVNLAIALFFTALFGWSELKSSLLISFSIGYCCWGMAELLQRWAVGRMAIYLLVSLVAVPIGFKLAAWLGATDVLAQVTQSWSADAGLRLLLAVALVALFAMSLSLYYFRSRALAGELEATQRREAESREAQTAAQLAMLQAQIEPHFLFNTLANVQSLIEIDPPRASKMLSHLNTYLRASLARSRNAQGTLGQELELVGALLDIAAIRMGERLRVAVEVAEELKPLPLPPLLLQPLVENALKHGLEPCVAGGELKIHAEQRDGRLCLSVRDTGVGIGASSPCGVGLANIRDRLTALYGGAASLRLSPAEPHGVLAELALPIA
ncbi:sensor histidine kinase [Chromobacterium sp. IIBBL 290-4]|uniref:sensor histidine kinase n=1 Tax=Chromobacterium sp. IIBBL 290-4 TaxID=2953890 RepID=UPI0020B8254A|nr:histidine kinase [Chromobacterium sp. IIBBL 290-4]UTH72886.1 histidine kinase [Chromobacterium sp. IIBBL 290-4]